MKLSLSQKREIVRRFWSGNSILVIAWDAAFTINWPLTDIDDRVDWIEQVLRDFMLGKFGLEKKRGK